MSWQQKQLPYRLALWRAPGVGPKTFATIEQHFSDLADLFGQDANALRGLGCNEKLINYFCQPDWQGVEQDIAFAEQPGQTIIDWHSAQYPSLLREIPDPPAIIFVQGDHRILSQQQIAMVGSRHPSASGRENAFNFARSFAERGLVVTSGLALGIDSASHQGALLEEQKTVAVTATGLDQVYPRQHKKLAAEIIQHGAIISEFPIGVRPCAAHFPRRNRIISGLSLGVVVVEAALRSGSLITARCALEQGRDVFALPGSIHHPLSKGCHALIRDGAKLVETVEQVLEELIPLSQLVKEQKIKDCVKLALDECEQNLVNCVGYDITPMDLLVVRSGLAVENIASVLVGLELKGVIQAVPGGYMRI